MQTKPKLPVLLTELVGAEYITDTPNGGVIFSFGERTCPAPKKHLKIIDGVLYVPQWMANTNQHKWHGTFVPDTRQTKMRPVYEAFLREAEEAMDAVERNMNRWRDVMKRIRGFQEEADKANETQRQAYHRQRSKDKQIDDGTAKIMQTINKH